MRSKGPLNFDGGDPCLTAAVTSLQARLESIGEFWRWKAAFELRWT